MSDQDSFQTHGFAALDQGEDLLASEMAGREDHVVLADQVEAVFDDRGQVSALVNDGQRWRRDAFCRQLTLDFGNVIRVSCVEDP